MVAVHISTCNAMASSYVCSQEVQGKLCTSNRQAAVLKLLQTQQKPMLQRLDDAFAVVEFLQSQVVDTACDDPASSILPHLVMPLLRDRLEAMAPDPQVGDWECKSHVCFSQQPLSLCRFFLSPFSASWLGGGGGGGGLPWCVHF